MRKILFRGKTQKNKWVFGGITMDYERVWIDQQYIGETFVKKETVGQYTGIKDENGTKIFEGDIIYCEDEEVYGVIEWRENNARFVINFINNIEGDFDEYYGEQLYVVGNIYDNPELRGKLE